MVNPDIINALVILNNNNLSVPAHVEEENEGTKLCSVNENQDEVVWGGRICLAHAMIWCNGVQHLSITVRQTHNLLKNILLSLFFVFFLHILDLQSIHTKMLYLDKMIKLTRGPPPHNPLDAGVVLVAQFL